LQYARAVRDGRIKDPQFLGLLYEYPDQMLEDEAYLEPKNFYITNPNLGASVDVAYLEREMRKAQEGDDESLAGFVAKHLNVEIGLGLKSNSWSGGEFWQQCGAAPVTFDELLKRSEVVTAGIDGGGLDDMLGMSLLGRETGTGKWLHWAHAWIHPIVLKRHKKEATRLKDFEKDGDLTIVKEVGEDIADVAQTIATVEKTGLLERVGVDPAGIGSIVDALMDKKNGGPGLPNDRIVGISQGWRMVGAIKTLERKLAEGAVVHGNSPLMAWCVGNARVEPRGNAVIITKQLSGSAKIDPLMATIDATSLMAMNPQARKRKFQVRWI
jgi:phage terminase large subunit-like protein